MCPQGKVGSAFTSVGGMRRGYGGHEAILQSFHATFLQHGMVIWPTFPSRATLASAIRAVDHLDIELRIGPMLLPIAIEYLMCDQSVLHMTEERSANSALSSQIVVGNPPNPIMDDALMATPFGVVMAGKEAANSAPSLCEQEVKLAYGMGEWTAQVTKMLHDDYS